MNNGQVRYALAMVKPGTDGKSATVTLKSGEKFNGYLRELDRLDVPEGLLRVDIGAAKLRNVYLDVAEIAAICGEMAG